MPRKTISKEAQPASTPMLSPNQLQLLFTVVNREKTDYYLDLIQGFQVNMQTVLAATGTANTTFVTMTPSWLTVTFAFCAFAPRL